MYIHCFFPLSYELYTIHQGNTSLDTSVPEFIDPVLCLFSRKTLFINLGTVFILWCSFSFSVREQVTRGEPYNISVLRALSNSEGMLIGGKNFMRKISEMARCRIMKLINEFHVVEQ
jgi:hypothetical protein